MSDSRRVARNSALNLAGLAIPLVVAIAAIPPLIRGLGAERFGILTLAWAAIGYFGLFEFGLGRALTHAVAVRLGSGEKGELPEVMWTALGLLLVLGTIGAVILALASQFLVTRVLNVPVSLQDETVLAFWILAASLPFVVLSVGLRGLMEAYQQFGVATALRVPLSAMMFLGPLMVLPLSRSLVAAVTMVALTRVVGFVAHLAYCVRRYEPLRSGVVMRQKVMRGLLRYGGWSTVTNVVSPIMVSLDRFVIGAILPLSMVTNYVTPYEAVMKLTVVPIAFLGAVFPVFASTFDSDRARMTVLYERTLRMVSIVTFPAALVAVALAQEGLHLWMGDALPPVSAVVLQWLAVGTFVNGIAQVPLSALQGAGRPDLIAKLHMAELPLYGVGLWWLTTRWGLPGVAIAWTLRALLDAIGLLVLSRRVLGMPGAPSRGGWWPVAAMLAALGFAVLLDSTGARVAYAVAVPAAAMLGAWVVLFGEAERQRLADWGRGMLTARSNTAA